MATKRDLVEAHSFSRRRLVTAFVSGAPGGREVEPTRPGRTIIGGVALAVLLLAGAAIGGILAGRPAADWQKRGLVIAKEDGTNYVITEDEDPVLHPVVNNTSAKLILGADLSSQSVAQEYIDDAETGDLLGILGAPTRLPEPDRLVDDGWTACTAPDAGIRLDLAVDPEVTALGRDSASVVSTPDGRYFLIADVPERHSAEPNVHAFELPKSMRDSLLSAIGMPPSTEAIPVPDDWVMLFPAGPPLALAGFSDLTRLGKPPATSLELEDGRSARVGDLVTYGDERILVSDDGLVSLTPFAAQIYSVLAGKQTSGQVAGTPPNRVGENFPVEWPAQSLTAEGGELCAQLDTEVGEAPRVLLAGDPGDRASALRGAEADASDGAEGGGGAIAADEHMAGVEAGHAAYFMSGAFDESEAGTPFVVDVKGVRYELVGPDTAALLGYGDHEARVVPDTWKDLFRCGVNLSQEDAMRPPDAEARSTCS
ncbi:type VII secretion protein EccB [Nocardioides pacificus]